jgi:hypothetical protein
MLEIFHINVTACLSAEQHDPSILNNIVNNMILLFFSYACLLLSKVRQKCKRIFHQALEAILDLKGIHKYFSFHMPTTSMIYEDDFKFSCFCFSSICISFGHMMFVVDEIYSFSSSRVKLQGR